MDEDGGGVVAGDDSVDAGDAVVKSNCSIEREMCSRR